MRRANSFTHGLSLCIVVAWASHVPAQTRPPQKPPDMKLPAFLAAKPVKQDTKDDELRKLLKARYNEALGEATAYYRLSKQPFLALRGDPDDLYGPWQRLLKAALELCDKPSEKVTLLTQYVDATKEAEALEQARYENGRCPVTVLHRARYERLSAEIQLLRAKRDADKVRDE